MTIESGNGGGDEIWRAGDRRSSVMGIVNVTPDSFSDGGRCAEADLAVAAVERMIAEGAAIVDIGGESTRPGFVPVPAEEEWRRVAPVLERLVGRCEVPLSIDTTKPEVARRALALGVGIVNDIWGLQGNAAMAEVVAEAGAGLVLMANREIKDPALDIVDELRRFFDRSLAIAERAGLRRDRVMLDPGIGFGKTPEQQLVVIRDLVRLLDYGCPILVGLSRKSFLGRITGAPHGERLVETLAANLAAAQSGARIFRVHDVAAHVAALKVFDAIRGAAFP